MTAGKDATFLKGTSTLLTNFLPTVYVFHLVETTTWLAAIRPAGWTKNSTDDDLGRNMRCFLIQLVRSLIHLPSCIRKHLSIVNTGWQHLFRNSA